MTSTNYRTIAADAALNATVKRLLNDRADSSTAELWPQFMTLGLVEVGSERRGPGGPVDACELLNAVGYHARSLPLAEAGLLGRWLARRADWVPADDETITVAPTVGAQHTVTGHADPLELTWHDVPWLADATQILAAVAVTGIGEFAIRLAPDAVRHDDWVNLAGEVRSDVHATVRLDSAAVTAVPEGTCRALRARGALSRAALVAGSLRRSVALASEHATSRTQFGKRLAQFQAVSHMLAVAAEHATLADAAVRVAAEAIEHDPTDRAHRVQAARSVTHGAVQVVSRNAHQIFGAMGVTEECELSKHTTRQFSWDNEWGLATEHTDEFGVEVLRHSDDFWVEFTRAVPTRDE